MINWNMISKIMGALLFFEAALMSLSLGISVYSGEFHVSSEARATRRRLSPRWG